MKKLNKIFNKKTMLIGAGLLAGISIIPITAVVLTSCSSSGASDNTTTTSTSTDFSTTNAKVSFLNDTFPSNFKNWYDNSKSNADNLKSFILDNVIKGKKIA